MARPATSPSARVAALGKAETKAAKLKRGQTLTAAPMADLLSVGWPILRGWCNDVAGFAESKAFVPGGNGIEWVFRPLVTIRFLKAHFQRELNAKTARARRVRQIIGGGALKDIPEDYTLEEMGKMIRLSTEIQSQKERQGQLVDGEGAAASFRIYHSTIQQAVLRAGQEQDPNGRWPPEIRESFENALRSVLLQVERAGTDCLKSLNGGIA